MKGPLRKVTRPVSAPSVIVSEHPDFELDWTPKAQRIRPRIVTVRKGSLMAEIQEARTGPDDEDPQDYLLLAGIGNDASRPDCMNVFCAEFTPHELDTMLDLLTIARDKAKKLGMPSAKR